MEDKTIIHAKCPACNQSLMSQSELINNVDSIMLTIETTDANVGRVFLSSIYGNYNYVSKVRVPDNEIVKFHCPSCDSNLHSGEKCSACEAPMVSLEVVGEKKVSFCSRNGCPNHEILQ
ncbi:MAG: hypothetical protein ACEPOV_10065 [Hyphomicrobiales bacterium]